MTAKVYAVTFEVPDSCGGMVWFFKKKDAKAAFKEHRAEADTVVNMYEVDLTDLITNHLDENLIGYDPKQWDLAKVLKTHTPAERTGQWEDLRTTETIGELYTEYTEGDDYWAFRVTKPGPMVWDVSSMNVKVGAVQLKDNMFPTFYSFDAAHVLIDTHVTFAEAVRSVAAHDAGLPTK